VPGSNTQCLSSNITKAGARVTKAPVTLPKSGLSVLLSHWQSASATKLQPEQHGDGTRPPEKLEDAHHRRKDRQGAGRAAAAQGPWLKWMKHPCTHRSPTFACSPDAPAEHGIWWMLTLT